MLHERFPSNAATAGTYVEDARGLALRAKLRGLIDKFIFSLGRKLLRVRKIILAIPQNSPPFPIGRRCLNAFFWPKCPAAKRLGLIPCVPESQLNGESTLRRLLSGGFCP